MKTLVLILMGLGVAILLSACGVFFTRDTDSATRKIADEYGGVYVFDKKFRDEIIQREKERKEYRKNRSKQIDEEEERILRTLFTEEEIQLARDEEERHKKKILYRTYYKITTKKEEEEHFKRVLKAYTEVREKENEILRDLWDNKYPDLVEEKFPQVLSNGCKYVIDEEYYFESIHHYPKLKKYVVEYMGEEVFEKLKSGLVVNSYYIDEEKNIVPISICTYITETRTKYGLYGDEGAGFRFSDSWYVGISGDNIFYLINDKFIKSNEKRFGKAK